MKANLKSHALLRHGAYSCTECDFRCTAKAALRAHTRQHAPARPLRCTCCPYSCTSKGALKRHERVHSDERPFTCHCCPFASKQRANLLVHMKNCHDEKVVEGSGKGAKRGKAGDESPGPTGSRYRVRLEAARAFCCNLCEASFVREDSLRSHKRQHNAEKQLRITQTQFNTPKQRDKGSEQVSLMLTNGSAPSYGNAQLKIFVAPPLGQEGTFIQAPVDVPSSKPGTVLLSSEGQNVILNPIIQQVSLLSPVQHMSTAEGSLEHQTVLLTHISGSEGNPLLQTNVSSQDPMEPQTLLSSTSESSHTFVTECSDLDNLHALIQQGGAEVTVVTEGHASITTATAPSSTFHSTPSLSEDDLKPSGGGGNPHLDDGLVVPDINIDPSSSLLVHNVTLSLSEQDQQAPIYQLSPHQIFSDSNPPDRIED